ncbi:hypothetical protein BMR02_12835 [Methylococcaceae bacterium HT1]|nr:hypothetical protein BMR02_12835 [Methylococcaceae bacterium HT1]TXL19609.1 hypothetical protein BMR03_15060 [Methylococcaceae bacterium HT2]
MSLQMIETNSPSQFSSSIGGGKDSQEIVDFKKKWLENTHALHEDFSSQERKNPSIEETLYDSRADCKIEISKVAMHLSDNWRNGLFKQLDSLMDIDNWEDDDAPVTHKSFSTLLRMLTLLRPDCRPGLGSTSSGNIIAAWTKESSRLTIECLPNDKVRWVLSHFIDNIRESAAGEAHLTRLNIVLAPYNQKQWFSDC